MGDHFFILIFTAEPLVFTENNLRNSEQIENAGSLLFSKFENWWLKWSAEELKNRKRSRKITRIILKHFTKCQSMRELLAKKQESCKAKICFNPIKACHIGSCRFLLQFSPKIYGMILKSWECMVYLEHPLRFSAVNSWAGHF